MFRTNNLRLIVNVVVKIKYNRDQQQRSWQVWHSNVQGFINQPYGSLLTRSRQTERYVQLPNTGLLPSPETTEPTKFSTWSTDLYVSSAPIDYEFEFNFLDRRRCSSSMSVMEYLSKSCTTFEVFTIIPYEIAPSHSPQDNSLN
jgi:hypothetical protein